MKVRKWFPHSQVWPQQDYYGNAERHRSETLAALVAAVAFFLAVIVPVAGGFWLGQRVATPAAYQQGYADGLNDVGQFRARDIEAIRQQAVKEERQAAAKRTLPVLPWEAK